MDPNTPTPPGTIQRRWSWQLGGNTSVGFSTLYLTCLQCPLLIHTCVNKCRTCHVLPNSHSGVILKIALCRKGIEASKWVLGARMRAISHTSQELWPWNWQSPKEGVQRSSQHTCKITQCCQGPSSVMWSHMWPTPQPNAIQMNFYSSGSSHMIEENKARVVSIMSAMVFWFCLTPRGGFWK
jgi:hypothetical protein